MDGSFESHQVRLVRRNPWIVGFAVVPFLVALLLVALEVGTRWWLCPGALISLSLLGWYNDVGWWILPRFKRVVVRADSRGIYIVDHFVPRRRLRDGFVLPWSDKDARILLRRRARPIIALSVDDVAEGRRLLRVLGLDAAQTSTSFRVASFGGAFARKWAIGMLLPFVGGLCGGFALHDSAASNVMFGLSCVAFLLAVPGLILLSLIPAQLRVGVDGIEVRWLWVRRFISYGQISAIASYSKERGRGPASHGLVLTLKGPETCKILIGHETTLMMVEERIREAQDIYRRGGAGDAALLARNGRDGASWLARLRAIGAGANADLRTAPLPREELFRIAEDPRSPQTLRAAAAVAIGARLDQDERERLFAAARATVAPRLRFAIEEAATTSPDDIALEAMLAELEAADEPTRDGKVRS